MQQSAPKISIIIPVYNVEHYLVQCMESVVNQTLDSIEIICVNDGSLDASLDILLRYAKNDQRIVIIDQANAGLGAARNVAVKKSKGEYLFFLDSDDWIALNLCETLYSKASENDLDILQIGLEHVYDGLDKPLCYRFVSDFNPTLTGIEANDEKYEITSFSCGKLWKRSFFVEYNLYNEENIYYEDQLTAFSAFTLAKRVEIYSECLYFYRIRSNSIVTSSTTLKHVKSSYFIAQKMFSMLEKHSLWNTYGFVLRFSRMLHRLNFETNKNLCDDALFREISTFILSSRNIIVRKVKKPFYKKNPVTFMVLKVPYPLWGSIYKSSNFIKSILKYIKRICRISS